MLMLLQSSTSVTSWCRLMRCVGRTPSCLTLPTMCAISGLTRTKAYSRTATIGDCTWSHTILSSSSFQKDELEIVSCIQTTTLHLSRSPATQFPSELSKYKRDKYCRSSRNCYIIKFISQRTSISSFVSSSKN